MKQQAASIIQKIPLDKTTDANQKSVQKLFLIFFPSHLCVGLQVSSYTLEEMKLLNLYPECSFAEVYKCFFNLQLYQNHLRKSLCHWQCYWVKGFMYLVEILYLCRTFSRMSHGLQLDPWEIASIESFVGWTTNVPVWSFIEHYRGCFSLFNRRFWCWSLKTKKKHLKKKTSCGTHLTWILMFCCLLWAVQVKERKCKRCKV